MIGLFFDVLPKPGHLPHYFAHVERLKPVLAGHPGLLFLERFRPLDAPDALLSHQLWRDEAAISAWRCDPEHRTSQSAGRRVHFQTYRLRIGPEVASEAGAGRFVGAAYGTAPLAEGRRFESVTRPGRFLTVLDGGEAGALRARIAALAGSETDAVRVFSISRDYTETDRAEAPD